MSKQAFKRVRRRLKMEVNRKPLDSFAWPGGYPLYYLTADGGALCPDCANKEIDEIDLASQDRQWAHSGWRLEAFVINYEDTDCYCCNCDKRIESAYGEND